MMRHRSPEQEMPPADRAELDAPTLARARWGESAACRALVEWYQHAVFALLTRMLRPAGRDEWVEDLAQETFLRVFRALPGFSPSGPARLSSWILTIASRLAIDELRRKRLPLAHPDAPARVAATERADEGAERRALREAIEQALASVVPSGRAALLLRACHGRSHREIAACLDLPIGTVKSRIARARQALRLALAEVEHG